MSEDGGWVLIKSTIPGNGYSPFEVIRENKRHVWLRTGPGETRYTRGEANWRFPNRELAVAEMHRLDEETTAFVKRMQGRS